MSPSISPPPPDKLADLLVEHSVRHPEKARLGPLTGDDGAPVFLPILLGNPKPDSKAFAAAIAAALRFRPNDDPTGEALVRDCVLWPPRAQWTEWRERWAAIDGVASRALARKLGSNLGVIVDPLKSADASEPDEASSIPIPEGASWRVLAPPGSGRIHVAVKPPSDFVWRAFVSMVIKPDADVLKLVREMVAGVVVGSSMPLDVMLDRWPGIVVALLAVASELAGSAADVILGEW